MKTSTIVIIAATTLILGGIGVAAMAGSTPQFPKDPLERPGYTIMPDCVGYKVSSESDAFEFARKVGQAASTINWLVEIQSEVFGNCSQVSAGRFLSYDPTTQIFVYNLLRATMRGGVEGQKIAESQALAVLTMLRNEFSKVGIDVAAYSTTLN